MGKLVPLSVLAAEGFAPSASAMWDFALDRELPVALDGRGRACMAASAADRLRQAKVEAEARAAAERERRRQEQMDAEYARVVAQQEQAQLQERVRWMEQRSGASLAQLDAEYRRQRLLRPGEGGSLEERERIMSEDVPIEILEQFVIDYYGEPLDEAS